MGLWDPGLSATSGTTGLVSSFAGTDSLDLTNGYNRSLASGGTMRLDLLTLSAVVIPVPEPSTCAMLAVAALIVGSVTRRACRAGAAARSDVSVVRAAVSKTGPTQR